MDSKELLSLPELAERLPPGRRGRPRSPETLRDYALRGLKGVLLYSEIDCGIRKSSLWHYADFRRRVAEAHERQRQENIRLFREARDAVNDRRSKADQQSHERAKKKLQDMGIL